MIVKSNDSLNAQKSPGAGTTPKTTSCSLARSLRTVMTCTLRRAATRHQFPISSSTTTTAAQSHPTCSLPTTPTPRGGISPPGHTQRGRTPPEGRSGRSTAAGSKVCSGLWLTTIACRKRVGKGGISSMLSCVCSTRCCCCVHSLSFCARLTTSYLYMGMLTRHSAEHDGSVGLVQRRVYRDWGVATDFVYP
jgi:hypothetical protein